MIHHSAGRERAANGDYLGYRDSSRGHKPMVPSDWDGFELG